jgi:tRNA dimethylallyltransferase
MNFDPDLLRQCWFLAGPTAVGKTGASLALAQQLNAEIISMDSMAIYRHMDIGTAKPSAEEQSVVPHHLIDVVDPHQEFSVAEFVKLAEQVAQQVVGRGCTPLFVGGTGLYLRSVLRGVFEGPEADWELRKKLQQQLEEHGRPWLHQQLAQVDEVTAKRLHENDTRRVIRALEVYHLTGIPLSQQQDQQPRAIDERPRAVFWLDPPRDWLHDRINLRVDQMMQEGLLQETRQLLELNPPADRKTD